MRNLILILSSLIVTQCTTFYTGERPEISKSTVAKSDAVVGYELIGWNGSTDRNKIKHILSAFLSSNRFRQFRHKESIDSDFNIQLILEASPKFQFFMGENHEPVSWMAERDEKRYIFYLINRIFSLRTFFVVPDINRDDDFLRVRVLKKGKIVREYRYDIESYNIFGWLSILAFPFDDRSNQSKIYSQIIYKFLEDSKDVF
ncbi:MAG: hypothetical protein MUF77_01970 [Leptospira sp.]|jgi:hypothetical protein|nr:hypothetical protein [Leptospira sp.]